MKRNKYTLQHADGTSTSSLVGADYINSIGDTVNTGLGTIGNTIINSLQINSRWKQIKEYFNHINEEDRHNYLSNLAYGGQKSDAGFYIIVALLILALGGGLVFALKYKKK